jgi:endonuclease YncB( thermonuclease family)
MLVVGASSWSVRAAPPLPSTKVVEIVDGDTLVVEPPVDGLREARLVGIQAPKLPLGRRDFAAWPLADEARRALAELALDREVTPVVTGRGRDRHGRLLAHLVRADGTWLQGEMLRSGFARVYTFADNRARAAEMLSLEREARAAGRGIWRHPFYGIRDATRIDGRDIGTFQLIEGAVTAAAPVKTWVYLNFGDDWRRDFTVSVPARAAPEFERAGVALDRLAGRRIRVRGWLDSFNGPMIEANHPEQIEILDGAAD